MINKDGEGGGQFLDFMGGHRAHGWVPPVPPLGKTLGWQPKIGIADKKYEYFQLLPKI